MKIGLSTDNLYTRILLPLQMQRLPPSESKMLLILI